MHSNPCLGCGYDHNATVAASWSFAIDRPAPSLNDRKVNAGPTRWSYSKERDAWCLHFRCERLRWSIPPAIGKRRAYFTRLITGRQQVMDYGNLVGGFKVIVDAMVIEKLLSDDSPEFLADYYSQRRSTVGGVHIMLEDLAP